jgi:hypothetical protein
VRAALPSQAAVPELVRCTPQTTDRLVFALVAAFNRGDVRAVDRVVAPEPAFQWFSAGGSTRGVWRLGPSAYDRATLAAYVRERHLHHERWTRVSVGGPEHLPLRLTRHADDMNPVTTNGKFDTNCGHGNAWIIVWSI